MKVHTVFSSYDKEDFLKTAQEYFHTEKRMGVEERCGKNCLVRYDEEGKVDKLFSGFVKTVRNGRYRYCIWV